MLIDEMRAHILEGLALRDLQVEQVQAKRERGEDAAADERVLLEFEPLIAATQAELEKLERAA